MTDIVDLGGYPDAGMRMFGRKLEVMLDDASGATTEEPHLLGETPDGYDAWLECVSDNHSYEEGDRIPIHSGIQSLTAANMTVSVDAENTYVAVSSNPISLVNRGSSPSVVVAANTKWKLVITPWVRHEN